jgi:anoctamin-10
MQKIKLSQLHEFADMMEKDYPVLKKGQDENLGYYLTRHQLMEELIPLHSKSKLVRQAKEGYTDPLDSDLVKQAKDPFQFFIDVEKIREYYGDEIAIYFEWMNYFQKWLFIPAIFAIVVFICNVYVWDLSTSPITGVFSIGMSLWGTFFLVYWRRRSSGLNILWDDYVIQHDEEDLRKEFKGDEYINPITDKPDTYMPMKKRLPLYVQSFIICFPCWCAVCFIVVAFLNVTGVIRPGHHGGAFDIPFLSAMADEGATFDPEGYANMGMAIVQAIVTIIMNMQFRNVAIFTAELENHKT